MHLNPATKITLIIGYILAVPPLFALFLALRHPEGRARFLNLPWRVMLASELIGAGCVTAGWIAAGNRSSGVFNGLWVVVCSTMWLRAENKLRLRRQQNAK